MALELLVPRDRSPRLKLDLLDKATVPVSTVLFRPQLEVLLFELLLVVVTHRLVARHPDLMLAVVSYPTSGLSLYFSISLFLTYYVKEFSQASQDFFNRGFSNASSP